MSFMDYWQNGFEHLTEYIHKHGNAHVPKGFVSPDGYKLGEWVSMQRVNYRKQNMDNETIQKLLSIGFLFDGHAAWEAAKEEEWKVGYSHLKAFYKENRHSNVTITFSSPRDGYPLGNWLQLQRIAYKNGRLSQEHYELLKVLEVQRFCGKSESRYQTMWNESFRRLSEYHKIHGNVFVPKRSEDPNTQSLYRWICRQKELNRKGQLSTWQAEKLKSVGLLSSSKHDTIWIVGFNHYVEYVLNKDPRDITYDYVCPDNYKLGEWIHRQVKMIKNGTIPENRLTQLKDVGFTEYWGLSLKYKESWDNGYEHLLAFYNRYGHRQVPVKYESPDGYKLGLWAHKQRWMIRDNSMAPERLIKLYRISFPAILHVVEPDNPSWDKGFAHLLDYYEQYGYAHVPRDYKSPDGYRLQYWCHNQENRLKNHKMTNEQLLKLTSIGFFKAGRDVKWEKGYKHLVAFYKEHKGEKMVNTYISPDGFPLGSWVYVQMQNYSLGRLSEQRINKLLAIGLVFKPIYNRPKDPWETGLNNLCLFYDTYRSYRIPKRYRSPDGFYLGNWAVRTRKAYKQLPLDKLIELERTGFLSNVVRKKKGRHRNGLYGF